VPEVLVREHCMLEETHIARVAFDELTGVLGTFLREGKECPPLDRLQSPGILRSIPTFLSVLDEIRRCLPAR
jgi:hypothetical protein